MAIYNPWRGLKGLPADVWLVFAVTLVNRAGTMALPFLVLYLTRHMHLPARTAGLAVAAYGAASLVGAPVAGRLSDRVGPFRVMEASLLASGALLFLFPLAETFPALLALTALWALAAEAVRPASLAALTAELPPERRKAAIALNRLAINLGMSVGPLLGGVLATVSFPLLFVVDGATSLVAGAVLAVAWRRLARRAAALAAASGAAPETAPPPPPERGRSVLHDRRMLAFLFATALTAMVFLQHESSLPVFLVRDLGFAEPFYGALFAVNTLLIVLLEVPLNLAMADWPHRRALVLGAGLCAAGFGALAFAASPLAVVLTVVVWTFGEMVLFPVSATYVADLAPPARRGEYMGAYSTTWGLAFTLGPWLGTVALDRYGAKVLWGLAFAVGAAAAALLGWVAREAPRAGAASGPAPA